MDRLPLSKKLSYATGGLALNYANLLISQWLLRLYSPDKEHALVPVGLFSLIFLSGRIMDGITDPLVGYISDHTRTRFGRRIPYVAGAILPTALVSCLMWMPPFAGGLNPLNAVYLLVCVQLFFIFWTLLANPYLSLIPQLSGDPKDRVDITTFQAVFIMFGTFLSAFIGNIKASFGWAGLGVSVGLVTLVSFLPTLFMIREPSSRELPTEGKALNPLRMAGNIASTFRNTPFIFLLASTSLFWFSLNLAIILVPFWMQYVVHMGDDAVVLAMLPFLVSNILFFFVFNALAKKAGKFPVFMITLAGSAVAVLALFLVREGEGALLSTQIAMAIYGIPTAGFQMLPNALLADVVDRDETISGQRREALYFGLQAVFQKVAIGFSITAAGFLMYWGGDALPTVAGLKFIVVTASVAAALATMAFSFYAIREKT
ncbi:MAG: MFS transporter [Spirochaetes bacterium]|nr:MFS transporter [Spirochaetota bacterium]